MSDPDPSRAGAQPLSRLSSLRQGDLVQGLALAVTGVGWAAAGALPPEHGGPSVGTGQDWSHAFAPPSGWSIILSQDCDLATDDEDEPTLEIGLVRFIDQSDYAALVANSYVARYFPLPRDCVPRLSTGQQTVVDLAWRSSVLKLSLEDSAVGVAQVLTDPQRSDFAVWLGQRAARTPFPDDLVVTVLNPFHEILSRRAKAAAPKSLGARRGVEKLVMSVTQWYVSQADSEIAFIGAISNDSMVRGGWTEEEVHDSIAIDPAGVARFVGELEDSRQQLHTELQRELRKHADSGYVASVVLADYERTSARDLLQWKRFTK